MTEDRNQTLDRLNALVGEWATVASNHRELPGVEAKGTASIEWLAGKQFLVVRSRSEHPYPDSLTVVGIDEANEAFVGHYYDSRGVHRTYGMDLRDGLWTIWRHDPTFGQRFVGHISEDGGTITGEWQHASDGAPLAHDFDLTYRKRP